MTRSHAFERGRTRGTTHVVDGVRTPSTTFEHLAVLDLWDGHPRSNACQRVSENAALMSTPTIRVDTRLALVVDDSEFHGLRFIGSNLSGIRFEQIERLGFFRLTRITLSSWNCVRRVTKWGIDRPRSRLLWRCRTVRLRLDTSTIDCATRKLNDSLNDGHTDRRTTSVRFVFITLFCCSRLTLTYTSATHARTHAELSRQGNTWFLFVR